MDNLFEMFSLKDFIFDCKPYIELTLTKCIINKNVDSMKGDWTEETSV